MSWKPLPHETPAKDRSKKTHIRARFHVHPIAKKNAKDIPNISYRNLQSISLRLLDFVKKGGKLSSRELGELIHDMQHSVCTLQKQRNALLNKEMDKKKNKKKNG